MTTELRTNFTNLATGVILATLGFALLFDALGLVEARNLLGFWPALLVLLGAAIIVQEIRGRDAGAPGTSQRPIVSPGFILFMVTIGIVISRVDARIRQAQTGADMVNLVAVMGKDERTIGSGRFGGGSMIAVMGRSELDLRQSTAASGEEVAIDVFAVMGKTEIHVPRHWTVDIRTVAIIGAAKDERFQTEQDRRRPGRMRGGDTAPKPAEQVPLAAPSAADTAKVQVPIAEVETGPRPRLVVRGVALLGGLVIKS